MFTLLILSTTLLTTSIDAPTTTSAKLASTLPELATFGDTTDVGDELLEAMVRRLFLNDPLLSRSGIEVAGVHEGVVLLEGRARTRGEARYAVETTAAIPGVRDVRANIEVIDEATDAPPRS